MAETQTLYGFPVREPDLRRATPGQRKTYEIKALWNRNHEIVNLAARGFKNVEIAKILNITPACVSMTLNSELGKKKLSEIRLERDEDAKKINNEIQSLTEKAIEIYHQVFDDDSGQTALKDKLRVADTVMLELSGLRVPTKVQSQSINTTLTPEELEDFKQRGLKSMRESGLIIDTKPEESTE